MTQEEKAKAYDEALKRANKELQACGSTDCDAAKQIFRFFPELKESEDERIRQELITHCRNTRCVTEEGAERIAKWIARLEKQGELVNSLSKGLDNAYERIDELIQKNNELCLKLEKQDKQKVPVVDFKAEDWYVSKVDGKIYNAKFMEKTPTNLARKLEIEKAAMSATGILEQEEWFIKGAEWADKNTSYVSSEKQGEQKPHRMVSAEDKEAVYDKPAWSAEDKFKVQRICKYLCEAKKYYADITEVRDCINWLKSLKQRIGG